MTFAELIRKTFNNMGIAEGDRILTNNVKGYINSAYLDIALHKYPVYKEETIAITDNKFSTLQLTNKLYRINSIWDNEHKTKLPWSTYDNQIFEVMPFGGDSIIVMYQYIPPPLVDDNDVPEIPEYYHDILPVFAQAEVLRNAGRTQEADLAMSLYEMQKNHIRRWTGEQNKFSNWW